MECPLLNIALSIELANSIWPSKVYPKDRVCITAFCSTLLAIYGNRSDSYTFAGAKNVLCGAWGDSIVDDDIFGTVAALAQREIVANLTIQVHY
jgi:hypothetical protein